jgi:zinc D-Ala-D-Ala carboxypeptidase|tara:strand:+ start:259 stop:723 length:465 start_codon:yes stop_codon:yes gene_type:complete
MKLTSNFSLAELTRSQTATRKGIDNTPNAEQLANLTALCECVLQPVRNYFGTAVRISSGLRVPELNSAIGGSTTSDHCKGMAADIEVPGVDNMALAKWVTENLNFRQVILEFYTPGTPDSGWVHVSYNPSDNKKQVLTATKKDGKTVYLPGLVA